MSGSAQGSGRTSRPAGQSGNVWQPRGDMRAEKFGEDAYRIGRRTPPEPSVCPDCGALFSSGRWAWAAAAPAGAHSEVCPACLRIRDKFPAGEITLGGEFLSEHRDEIFGLVRNQEEAERSDHALHRIMGIDEGPDGVVTVTTTDIHLPRRILEALHRAYEGEMEFQYGDDETSLRGHWSR